MKTLTINGKTYSISPVIPVAQVNLPVSGWRGDSSPYYQAVPLSGVTQYTKVDLQPTLAQIDLLHAMSTGFFAVNQDGAVTVYAVGNKPTQDFAIQVTLTEVEV